jgi:Zn-dependent protease
VDEMLINAISSLLSGQQVSLTSVIAQLLSVLFVMFLILPFHEYAHARVAVKLGDNTPIYDKRLTLNPLASVDIMGSLALLLFGFGWAKPVQVNARNFKNPKKGMAIVALAGPAANLIAALVGACIYVPVYIFTSSNVFIQFVLTFLSYYIQVNVILAVFNFIPIPPLDGSRIVGAFLSDRALYNYYRYQNIIVMIFFAVMISGILSTPLSYVENFFTNIILRIAEIPYYIAGVIR